MRSFVTPSTFDPVPSAVLHWLRIIDQGQGREQFYQRESKAVLDSLATRSRIESVIASNEIEGITAPRRRAERVIDNQLAPRDRPEQELAGYRAALDDVYSNPHQAITLPRILGWHRYLLQESRPDIAGRLKVNQNTVEDRSGEVRRKRFDPVSPAETESHLRELLERTQIAIQDQIHPVLVTAAFVLDLLVIHPFEDGNGRTARIATNALLMRSDYTVGRYISLERQVEQHRTRYYDTLGASTLGWHTSEHSLWPWATYLSEMIANAYVDLDMRTNTLKTSSAQDLTSQWLSNIAPNSFTFAQACSALTGIAPGTIRSVLNQSRIAGALTLEGSGRGTRWVFLDRTKVPSSD